MTSPAGALDEVVHLVDAMGTTRLWGKERAVLTLMEIQRADGLRPALVAFRDGALADEGRKRGFPTHVLGDSARIPLAGMRRLKAILREHGRPVLHTHGYKANVVGRFARLAGATMSRLVATVHGMNDETRALLLYNRIDLLTAPLSDVVALADASLLARFRWRGRALFVANGIAGRPPFTPAERAASRARFGFAPQQIVVGLLGRVSEAKGALDVLEAARSLRDPSVVFAFGGEGEIAERSAPRPSNVRFLGFVDGDAFLAGVDVYLQGSHGEGLSLALLEAMRGGIPCIATRVGSTDRALEGDAGVLIPAHDPAALRAAVAELAADARRRAFLGAAARRRFEDGFTAEHQHRRYLALYRDG